MADVSTLIDRLEALRDGEPLPGDEEKYGGLDRGFYRRNTAEIRCMAHNLGNHPSPVPARLACELYDSLPTILAALYYWRGSHRSTAREQSNG